MKTTFACIAIIIFLVSCENRKKENQPFPENNDVEESLSEEDLIVQKIAANYGVDNWHSIQRIRFTFNVDRNGNHFERNWIWNPKTNRVQLLSEKDTVSYDHGSVDSLYTKTDAAFINDKFWLLAPFQLVWDKGMKFSNQNDISAPISKTRLSKLTVAYPDTGGYTPGDAYDFYYGPDYLIKEWSYRKGNAPDPSLTMTWEDNQTYRGIVIATRHRDSLGNLGPYFTNISVE